MARDRSRKTPPLRLPVAVEEFAESLLGWYQANRRDLPWRRETDAYRVWLSEVMLQQTQVKTALPYYRRFLERYPTLQDLARAELSDVLAEWAGLGYYSRARNLHRAAGIVCDQYGGEFPADYRTALALPGVGRYTAGAILSIVYNQPLPILDGNIRRLMARYLCIHEEIQSRVPALWNLLEELTAHPDVRKDIVDFNQALMELGALICRPRNPACDACPLEGTCRGLQAGIQGELPVTKRNRETVDLHYAVAIVRRGTESLLRRNQEGPLPKGFWEPPRVEQIDPDGVEEAFRTKWGLQVRVLTRLQPVRHQITHHRLLFTPMICELQNSTVPRDWRWSDLTKRKLPFPAYVVKIERRVQGWLRKQKATR